MVSCMFRAACTLSTQELKGKLNQLGSSGLFDVISHSTVSQPEDIIL